MANNISDEMYERLREILEKHKGRTYTFEEAKENGQYLIDFFLLINDEDESPKESFTC